MHTGQPAFSLAVGLVFGLLAGGVLIGVNRRGAHDRHSSVDDLLVGLAGLAAFGIAAFVAYVLF